MATPQSSHDGWLRPTDAPDAADFADLLARTLDPITPDDFGGEYPWNADVPPRADWDRHAAEFRAHLEREGWYDDAVGA